MAAAEVKGREIKLPPALPTMEKGGEDTTESPRGRSQEEGRTQVAWHSNPLGLAGILRKREEIRRVANDAHKVAMERRNQEYPPIEIPAKIEKEKVCITVPETIIERNATLWKFALVGRFTGPRPDLDRIRYWATLRWRVTGIEIIALPKGCVLFNFPNQEDMLRVLLKAPWYMEGKGLLLEKWHKEYNPKSEETQMVPVWVQIPNLPLQCWDKDIIKSIANAIGKIIAIDSATSNRTRLIQARFCVLVRIDKLVPTKVELEMEGMKWIQDLIYETAGIRCFKCRRGGHLPQNCDQHTEEEQRQESNNKKKEAEEIREEEEEASEPAEEKGEEKGSEGDSEREEGQSDTEKGEHQTNKSKEAEAESQDSEEEETTQEKQEQDKEVQKEARDKQKGKMIEEKSEEDEQAEEEPEVEPEAPTIERQQEKVVVQFEPEEEYDEEHEKWLRKQQKKARQREKWRRETEELREGVRRYYTRNRSYQGGYYRRPGRPTNQETREREAQREIDQGKQKTLEE